MENYLNGIVGEPLQYGIKTSDLDLFQLGFGESISVEYWKGKLVEINKYAVHFDSAVYLYWKDGKVDMFYPDAHTSSFNLAISKLVGKIVKRIALSSKNDFWIELDNCRMVIVTRDDEDESWRFFCPRTRQPHLVASSTTLMLDED